LTAARCRFTETAATYADWLHVEITAPAFLLVLAKGRPGEKYNIGGDNERSNLEIVERICDLLDDLRPAARSHRALRTFVPTGRVTNRRYAIDATRIRRERSGLGRRVTRSRPDCGRRFAGISSTGRGCEQVQAGRYDRQRLGLG